MDKKDGMKEQRTRMTVKRGGGEIIDCEQGWERDKAYESDREVKKGKVNSI